MPEGPEIRRAADQLAAALKDRVAEEVFFGQTHLKPFERRLRGEKIRAVETRGKAILTRFGNGLNIYSHNQLYGRWHTGPARVFPESTRTLRLAIHNDTHSALLYSASDIAVLTDDELATHPFLKKLGPDVLAPETTPEQIVERLQSPAYQRRQLGGLLTDQSFLAGLGNYLRCEILFAAGLTPATRPRQCSPGQLTRLAQLILGLARQSYETGGITNDQERAKRLMEGGSCFEDARFYVFRRAGRPCYRCGATIEKGVANGQGIYFCRHCQGDAERAAPG